MENKNVKWMQMGYGVLLHPVSKRQITTEVVELDGYGRIFEVYHYGDDPQTTQNLIASAPELLEALEQAEKVFNVETIDPMQAFVMIEKMRGLIAKAKGTK